MDSATQLLRDFDSALARDGEDANVTPIWDGDQFVGGASSKDTPTPLLTAQADETQPK